MKTVLLSFDLEEFDIPLEFNHPISFSDQIKISQIGTEAIASILDRTKAKATFFCTYTFAKESVLLLQNLSNQGHEFASHGYYHSQFDTSDLLKSRQGLESLGLGNVVGFRMPRMMPVDLQALAQAGYYYDSSINPVYLPGRYNNYFKKRSIHKMGNIWEVPAAATPFIRVPLFWLSLHHLPISLYKFLCKAALFPDHHIVLYFHPWEFVKVDSSYGLPSYMTKRNGPQMINRLEEILIWMQKENYHFSTLKEFVENYESNRVKPE